MFPIISLAELLPQEKRTYSWNTGSIAVTRKSIFLTHCSTLQHTATHTTAPSNILQHTAAHCSTLRHTASHCITLYLQHIANRKNAFRAWFEFFLDLKIESKILPKWKESNIIWATPVIRLLESSVCLSVCLSICQSLSLSLSLPPPSPPHILPLPSIGHLECVCMCRYVCVCACVCVCVCVSAVLNSTEWQLGLCLCRCLYLSLSLFFSPISLGRACARASEQARVHCLALARLLALSRARTRFFSLACSLSLALSLPSLPRKTNAFTKHLLVRQSNRSRRAPKKEKKGGKRKKVRYIYNMFLCVMWGSPDSFLGVIWGLILLRNVRKKARYTQTVRLCKCEVI